MPEAEIVIAGSSYYLDVDQTGDAKLVVNPKGGSLDMIQVGVYRQPIGVSEEDLKRSAQRNQENNTFPPL